MPAQGKFAVKKTFDGVTNWLRNALPSKRGQRIYGLSRDRIEMYSVTEHDRRLYNSHKETIDTSASTRAELPVKDCGPNART